MTITRTDLLVDAFSRVHEQLPDLLRPLSREALLWRPDADANPIGWLVWHLTRVQDDHMAGVGDVEQVYTRDDFAGLFGLPYPVAAHGYGMTSDEVGQFTVDGPDLLLDYQDAVHTQTLAVLAAMGDDDYDRIVDTSYDPPVTAAARIVSVVNDITEHAGQAAYVAGLAGRPR